MSTIRVDFILESINTTSPGPQKKTENSVYDRHTDIRFLGTRIPLT